MKNAIVIGAGIGGIATSIRLAKNGYKVSVFEKNATPGGKISEIKHKGFRFDTGPSLFTLPELVEELFQLCGEELEEHLKYSQVDPICNYFYADGTLVHAYADPKRFATEMQTKTGEPEINITGFLKKYRELYNMAAPVFLFNSFHRLKNFLKPEFKATLFKLHKLDSLKTMSRRNSLSFKSPKTVQLFNRYATYNGSNPYKTPATLNMISHLEHNLGAFFPERGMYSIVTVLVALAERQGVTFYYNSPVTQLVTDKKAIKAVMVNYKQHVADIVVTNADAATFYRTLLTGVKLPGTVKNRPLSSSGIIFYWGVNRQFPQLELHNILFSEDYKSEFDHIFKLKTIYSDPTVYIFISSKMVTDDAPAGCENWFVMVNTPANYGQDWENMVTRVRKNIIAKINVFLKTDIEPFIVSEHVATPETIELNTGSYKGALYGNSSNGPMAAFMRHSNFSSHYNNLYFAGGSVHPGGGIPLCLCSAKITAELIADDFLI